MQQAPINSVDVCGDQVNNYRSCQQQPPKAASTARLQMPSQRRREVAIASEQLKEMKIQKEQRLFIKRKAKLISNQWRNGIAGVEDANQIVLNNQHETGYGYEEVQPAEAQRLIKGTDQVKLKNYFDRAENRKEKLRKLNGASEQFDFFTSPKTVRTLNDPQGQRVLTMSQSWNQKARVTQVTLKQGALQTHNRLFDTKPAQPNPARVHNLM